MVKLIACDIDGTLLSTSRQEISPLVFDQLGRLLEKGIVFAAASGRQYLSLRRLFAPFEDKIYYICNNGAVIYKPYSGGDIADDLLSKTPLPRQETEELCRYIMAEDKFELLVGGESMEYIIPKSFDLSPHLNQIGYSYKTVSSTAEIPDDIIKVSAFCPDGAQPHVFKLQKLWGGRFNVALSGKRWIDITLSDKGTGLFSLCSLLGVSLRDAMAIGDNYNDLPMLKIAGHPVVMEGAVQEIKNTGKHICSRVEDILAQV